MPGLREEILHDILPDDSPGEPFPNETGEWKVLKGKHSAPNQLQQTARASLFNIERDPSEAEDLSRQYPKIVQKLLKRIEYYFKGVVLSPNPKEERLADPRYRRGFWEPWYEVNVS